MIDDLFDQALNDVCGKIRVGGDDRRWFNLFNSDSIQRYIVREDIATDETMESSLTHHFERLINNNPTTGNFVQLLDQSLARLREISHKKSEPPVELIEQCCTSLYLCCMISHHFIARMEASEVMIYQRECNTQHFL